MSFARADEAEPARCALPLQGRVRCLQAEHLYVDLRGAVLISSITWLQVSLHHGHCATGWCTGPYGTASSACEGGDRYVCTKQQLSEKVARLQAIPGTSNPALSHALHCSPCCAQDWHTYSSRDVRFFLMSSQSVTRRHQLQNAVLVTRES